MTGPTGTQLADDQLAAALLDADHRVLVMCLFQITGDRKWIRDRYRPVRDSNLIADEQAGFDAEIASEIRDAARSVADLPPAISDPGDELMTELMGACLGQHVPPEYAPMMREEMGFCSRDVPVNSVSQLSVLVVGAGASGIAVGVRLLRMGVTFSIVERASSVGGVWRDNRYPGAGVDTPNHAYSFSFMPPHDWSRFFAPQPELEGYLVHTAESTGLAPNIEFETTLRSASWLADEKQWQVELETVDGTEIRLVDVLIPAIGQLNVPRLPLIEGMSVFEGPAFHSQEWPADIDVTGRRVAVVGTGASAMQIVPAIVEHAESVTIYQRSPQWARSVPRYHDPIPAGSRYLFDRLPFYAAWFRFTMLWRYGDGLLPSLRIDPDWPHPERSLNKSNDRHRQQMTDQIIAALDGDEDLIAQCVPDYPPYGKRILLDNGWFEALQRPDVELVSAEVTELSSGGVVAADGQDRPADVVVFATGFHVTEGAARLNICGLGSSLADAWADDDPRAYLGIAIPGFPNLFVMQGPNTGLGHGGSAILQAESQARYITSCIAAMNDRGLAEIEVREAPYHDYNARLDAEHEQLIWSHPGMSTYYRNSSGRVVMVMPWRLVDYWRMCHDVDLSDFRVAERP